MGQVIHLPKPEMIRAARELLRRTDDEAKQTLAEIQRMFDEMKKSPRP